MAFFLLGMCNRDLSKAWPTEPGWDSLSAKDARVSWSEVRRALWEYKTIIAISLWVLTQDQHFHSARLWSLASDRNGGFKPKPRDNETDSFLSYEGGKKILRNVATSKKIIYSSLERHCFCNSELNLQDLQLWRCFIIAVVTVSHIFCTFLSWKILSNFSLFRHVCWISSNRHKTVVNDVNNFWTVTSRKANIWMTIHSREGSP